MRRIEDIENVLLPNLRGEFVFAILGSSGYGRAVLARTERGFTSAVRCLIGGEGREYGKVLVEPQRILVVSYSPDSLQSLAAEHAAVEAEQFDSAVRRDVGRYYGAFRALPRGFSRTENDDAIFVGYDTVSAAVYAEWAGEGTLLGRFGATSHVEFSACEGAVSTAPPATGDVSVVWLDRSEAPWVEPFADATRAIAFHAPAFLFETIEMLPDALTSVREEAKACRARREAESDARTIERHAAREKFLEGEREALRAMFGDPVEVA